MLNLTEITANAVADRLSRYYASMFDGEDKFYGAKAAIDARHIVELLTNGDALYHNTYHTVMVTMVGQEIFRGRFLRHRLGPEDWFHYTLALLTHDIGYVRGALRGDRDGSYVIDDAGNRIDAPRGASDAFLTPYHVDRGKMYARERLGDAPYIDENRVARAIELTRFPVPEDSDRGNADAEAGLVRAADLIGQLGDPNYPQRLTALYYEFVETGMARTLGYESAADLADNYPSFFWQMVRPYIGEALGYLELTQEGRQWIAMLHSHVFAIEHDQLRLGPARAQHNGGAVF